MIAATFWAELATSLDATESALLQEELDILEGLDELIRLEEALRVFRGRLGLLARV